MSNLNPKRIYYACGAAIAVTGLSFAVRAGMLLPVSQDLQLSTTQVALIAGAVFWGFPASLLSGGFLINSLGVSNLIRLAIFFHVLGLVLIITAGSFWPMWWGMLLVGSGNGINEAVANPLVASLFPEEQRAKINHLHRFYPIGIAAGCLVVIGCQQLGWDWRIQNMLIFIPVLLYAWLYAFQPVGSLIQGFSKQAVRTFSRNVRKPLFPILMIGMMGAAVSEAVPNQWMDLLLRNVLDNPLLILAFIALVMVLGRTMGARWSGKFAPGLVLCAAGLMAAAGLWIMGASAHWIQAMAGAGIFAFGASLLWPNTLGYAMVLFRELGPLGMAVLGTAGSLGNAIALPQIGRWVDRLMAAQLPPGADLVQLRNAAEGSSDHAVYLATLEKAGQQILLMWGWVPLSMGIVYGISYLVRRQRAKSGTATMQQHGD